MKVEMFHSFYQHIEEIQTTMIKLDPLVVESLDIQMKIEDGSSFSQKDEMTGINDRSDYQLGDYQIAENHTKFDSDFDDNYWHDEFDDNEPETSTSN